MELNHFDENGNAIMVDISGKSVTHREATAKGDITLSAGTLDLIEDRKNPKGDVLAVSRIAGITAVKKTWELIPLAHPLPITKCSVDFRIDRKMKKITAFCTVKTDSKTGVEMEALTGVTTALLTIYDMCKAMSKRMTMGNIHLVKKTGGKSGDFYYGPFLPVISVAGLKNSGKTTFIEALIKELTGRGIKPAVIKNGCHFTPDTPGTDTYRFFQAGAEGTVIFDSEKMSVSRRVSPDSDTLSMLFPEADIIIVEGMRDSALPMVEIIGDNPESPVLPEERVLAYISDRELDSVKPVFRRSDIKGFADFLEESEDLLNGIF